MRIKSWNAEELLARSDKILREFGPQIADEARAQVLARNWDWPSPTFRRIGLYSGKFVPKGLRDIVDTGTLLNSQTEPVVVRDGMMSVLTIRWTAPYAAAVQQDSFVTASGAVAKPRNWIGAALQQKPFKPFFLQRWRELAGGGKA